MSSVAGEAAALATSLVSAARECSASVENIRASSPARSDCVRLARKLSLVAHLFEEINDSVSTASAESPTAETERPSSPEEAASSSASDPVICLGRLVMGVEAVNRFFTIVARNCSDAEEKGIAIQFQYVTWQLEKVLGNIPYDYFNISDEVQEQVELVRAQLRRMTEQSKSPNLSIFSDIYLILSSRQAKDTKRRLLTRSGAVQFEKSTHLDEDLKAIVCFVSEVTGKSTSDAEQITTILVDKIRNTDRTGPSNDNISDAKAKNSAKKSSEDLKKSSESPVIPEDFRCPISLELMRDPVIVSTGQTYERSYIQRWIDAGNTTCPKTQLKLKNLTLTPNYVLKSLIMQWCEDNKIEQSHKSSGRIKRSDGSFNEVSCDKDAIDTLVHNLSNGTTDEKRAAAAEIRSLAKRSTDNRILIAEAGAIPILIKLLSSDDLKTQEHAVTSLLNLSIYDDNKEKIMFFGALRPIIGIIKRGSEEAKENAAAAIFSLSIVDENKITIGEAPGAIESLVELLSTGSSRGKKDAATALFNLCIYKGNKSRAIRAGILIPLLAMLNESSSSHCMVDEALTILSVLVSHPEAKSAVAKANLIPLLIDLLRTGQPRNKENAAAILLALCKKDNENLACLGRLGAVIPLTELAKSGTDRAKRKVTSLLEQLEKLQTL